MTTRMSGCFGPFSILYAFPPAFFVLMALQAGCAQRFDEVDEKLAAIDKRTGALEGRAGFAVGSDKEILQGQKLADVRTQVGSLRNDITVMAGKIESLEFENKRLTTKTEALSEDIRDLQQQMKSRPHAEPSTSPEAAPAGPQADYDKALKAHQDGDFANADKIFKAFVQRNPRHPLADNALYWIADGFMEQKLYKQAVSHFQELIDRYPKSDKRCDAMSRQITALKNLGLENESKAFAKMRESECK